jgi:N-carbamoylputrescine amidase
MKKKVTVGLVQTCSAVSPAANLAQAEKKVIQAAKRGVQIVCLQELFKSPYFPQRRDKRHFELAEAIPGPTTDIFSALAKRLRVVIIVPLFEKAKKAYYNSAVVIDATGEILGTYRKTHLPNDPCYYEQFYFSLGDLGFKSFKTKYAEIGVLICWDQWFPEAARQVALLGAEILFYPSAIGWISGESKRVRSEEQSAWEMIQRSHAIANGIYVASANRVGREGKLNFWGNSFVVGPFGEMVARASGTRDDILIARCDFSKIKKIRKVWPFLKSLRPEIYGELERHCEERSDEAISEIASPLRGSQ